jgi:nucleoside-diphosphate-sugar epimerase
MSASDKPVSVVTGGAGFLGSHLTDRLLAEGHRVIAIDNLITGNVANIGHLAGNENYRFIRHNVSNFIFLPEQKIDFVFHFASPASPIDYLELPIPTLKVGALGTHNTLGLAKDNRSARAAFTMRPSVLPKPSPWRITVITASIPRLFASLIPMARECVCTMGEWYLLSSVRH